LLAAAGRKSDAAQAARLAMRDSSFQPAASHFLAQLGVAPLISGRGAISRTAPCPCGSGKRFKHCHGADTKADESVVVAPARELRPAVAAARADSERGNFASAMSKLRALPPSELDDADDARIAGTICDDAGRHDLAIEFLSRSLELRDDGGVRSLLAETCARHFRELSEASMRTVDMGAHPSN